MLKQIWSRRYEILLALLIGIYIFILSYASINRMLTLRSHYFDLGIMNQTTYNTADGKFLQMTNQDFKKNISRLAIHFDPVLAFFAPFYKIYNGPQVLLVGQTIILGLGAAAVYMIAHHILSSRIISLLFATSYLLYFPLQRQNMFDFHGVTLATTLLLFTLYFGLVRKHAWSFLFIILALLTKENVGLVTFFYGAYLFFFKKERKWGLIISAISIITFITTVFYIIPYFRENNHFALHYYGDFSKDPADAAGALLFQFFSWETLKYLSSLFAAHGIFILFSPITFLIALPELMINTLSRSGNMRAIYFHYNAVLIPFIFFSAIHGFNNLNNWFRSKKGTIYLVGLFILTNLWSIYMYNPLPSNLVSQPHRILPVDKQKLVLIRHWQTTLRDDTIAVSTTPSLAPFFTSRNTYYNFLFDPAFSTLGQSEDDILKQIDTYVLAEYVIVDKKEFENKGWAKLLDGFYQHLRNNPDFQQIFASGDIEVYRKL